MLRFYCLIFTMTFAAAEAGEILTLTDDDFAQTVEQAKDGENWLVKFYAPWCQHCKKLEPIYKSIVKKSTGEHLKFAEVECAGNQKTMETCKIIKRYPTILMYPNSELTLDVFTYQGDWSESDIEEWIASVWKEIEYDPTRKRREPSNWDLILEWLYIPASLKKAWNILVDYYAEMYERPLLIYVLLAGLVLGFFLGIVVISAAAFMLTFR